MRSVGLAGDHHLLCEDSCMQLFSGNAVVFFEPSRRALSIGCSMTCSCHVFALEAHSEHGFLLRITATNHAISNTGACDNSDSVVVHEVPSQHVETLGRKSHQACARQGNSNGTNRDVAKQHRDVHSGRVSRAANQARLYLVHLALVSSAIFATFVVKLKNESFPKPTRHNLTPKHFQTPGNPEPETTLKLKPEHM